MTLSKKLTEAIRNPRGWHGPRRPPGRQISILPDLETSEVSDEFTSVLKAMKSRPPTKEAEMIQNGITLAVAKGSKWKPTKDGLKLMAMEKRGINVHNVQHGWQDMKEYD